MSLVPLKILHVEDNPVYPSPIQMILKDDQGLNYYDVVRVDSLEKALQELKYTSFGAVLLDLSLHDARELDNVRAIKDENPDIPIIVLSDIDNEDLAMKALDEGAQDFIVKGYANHKLIRLAIKSSIKRKAVERDLYYRANYDDLTGLANRKHFLNYLQRDINSAKRWNLHKIILFIDIDRFKQINDTYGHEAGNAVLREVGQRFTGVLRKTDIVARYGGDEFVVLLDHSVDPNCDPKFACASVVTKLEDTLNRPITWQGNTIEFSTSIGIAIYPYAGQDMTEVLENADKAMYEAKRQGGSQFRFAVSSAETQFAISTVDTKVV